MKVFFLVLARDEEHVEYKIEELESLNVQYLIVCGKKINHSNVVIRKPIGKYDAINYGAKFIPFDVDIVALNDVDTKISNIESALKLFNSRDIDLVFARVLVREGPQKIFYKMLDPIRRRILITASGELMLIRKNTLDKIIPLKPCKAEDSYILFKTLELKRKAIFSEDCYAETKRTNKPSEEESYKRRTVAGIYQSLRYTKPPSYIRIFYMMLPLISPLLLFSGKKGYFWMKGILYGFIDFLKGDKTGIWKSTYNYK